MPKDNFNPADAAVEQLLTALEQAENEGKVEAWVRGWVTSKDVNAATKHEYSGFNVIRLALAKALSGFTSNIWVTYKQAKTLGGAIKSDQYGNSVILVRPKVIPKLDPDTGETRPITVGWLYFRVYNIEQTEGISEEKYAELVKTGKGADIVPELEDVVSEYCTNVKLEVKHGGNVAYYSPTEDYINLPETEKFNSTEEYAATKAHEVIHSTGTEKRLKRFKIGDGFDKRKYAADELVAELGAYALCVACGVAPSEANSIAYLHSWKSIFRDEGSTALVHAASKAQEAVRYVLNGGIK